MSAFHFKLFSIHQDKTAMKVGTDGVLLGAWAAEKMVGKKVLDIGTGTGLIAIMLAQKNEALLIDAIEPDDNAFAQATQNVFNCSWANRINVLHIDLQQYRDHHNMSYDNIICNPPYFYKGWEVENSSRKRARDAGNLPQQDIISAAIKLLDKHGKLYLILPKQEGEQFIISANTAGLFCCEKTMVYTKPGLEAKRLLMAFCKTECTTKESAILIADETGNYTNDYKILTGAYYLNF